MLAWLAFGSGFRFAFDGSAASLERRLDVDAFEVPEPGLTAQLAAGAILLAASCARRRRGLATGLAPVVGILLGAGAADDAFASDGVAEINQACATATGCFSGDAPEFPVTIDGSAGKNFRLTSDLVIASADVTAILIQTGAVSLDLAGHSIRGPVVCTGTPVTSCAPGSGLGSGIEAAVDPSIPPIRHAGHRIWDGEIRGMGASGLLIGTGLLSDLRIESNAGTGIESSSATTVDRCVVSRNGGDGILLGPGGESTLNDSTIHANGGRGLVIGSGSAIGNVVDHNGATGIVVSAEGLSIVAENVVRANLGDGIEQAGRLGLFLANVSALNSQDGFDVGLATARTLVQRNLAQGNSGFGLRLGPKSAYRENAVTSGAGSTITAPAGAVDLGSNTCNGAGTCP